MTTNTDAPQLDSQSLWRIEAPVVPTLDPSLRETFFAEAPVGTVVEFYDELYTRGHTNWIHLQELVNAGHSYSDYREHATSTAEYMAKNLTSEYTQIRVLRIGEAPAY